jgi:hypothetical protein
MFSLGIRYLMGWAMAAADGAQKRRAEWPPHPDRVFMAMAAAWFETGQNAAEGAALGWLEALPAPGLAASGANPREVVTHFVPVNDAKLSAGRTIQKLVADPQVKLGDMKDAGLSQVLEFRVRQPRAFPVAIPYDPDVHLIWDEDIPQAHRVSLESLCRKVTSIGHSASLVQMWVEGSPPAPTLVPRQGVAPMRLRVFGPGRLQYLEQRLNRSAWVDFHDRQEAIKAASEKPSSKKDDLFAPVRPKRFAWDGFPDVLLLAGESVVKQHPRYAPAKSGDAAEAARLVQALVQADGIELARALVARSCKSGAPVLASAHAYEREGVNAIPAALAELLSERLGLGIEAGIVQTNVVSHTGADGWGRLARQAAFEGTVEPGREYILVDDFVGQGGTLANLRGHILDGGGKVAASIVLTGKPYSATLTPSMEQLDELRNRHGKNLEQWWSEHVGHSFDCLTQSEARYLARTEDADTIRDRLAQAQQGGSGTGHSGGVGRRLTAKELTALRANLQAEQVARHPHGAPASLRPEPGLWMGYGPPATQEVAGAKGGCFDPRLMVLGLFGKRLNLAATLKLTEALRGALLSACPEPIPEWISGHAASGEASRQPHIALLPLPFAGAEHADGRLIGVALALPRGLDPTEAARVLEPWLRDEHGMPRPIRLFDGQWLECVAELETRERPPLNLRLETWTGPARRWASVTPVVLDRHFDGPNTWEHAAETVKDACERIGLPRPLEVVLHPVSLIEGVPRSSEFPLILRKRDGGRMHHAHAVLVFGEEVLGPVLVGAGRFRGYGLCRPLMTRGGEHA